MKLYNHQIRAVQNLKSGKILCGGVGSGKSLTALAWYYLQNGGSWDFLLGGDYCPMDDPPTPLYIITTARKRDTLEWEGELNRFLIDIYQNKPVVDSWNNIGKYEDVKGAIFIFDEQRVIGSGAWVKSFLKITKWNQWLLLSATPGDCWSDYIPVFVANGFYKNRSEFTRKHIIYSPYTNYPKVDRYVDIGHLLKLRQEILVKMDFDRITEQHHEDVYVDYEVGEYKAIMRNRWNPWTDKPIQNAAELCFCLRRQVNESEYRMAALLEILENHPRAIVFYNYDYELELLRGLVAGSVWPPGTKVAEWNGHKHEPIPNSLCWVYLVQYTAGAEGWNCTDTDTVIFYSPNYSYKLMTQAAGRIDRLNTPYTDLWYFHLKTRSGIELAIDRALKQKKDFNENAFWKENTK